MNKEKQRYSYCVDIDKLKDIMIEAAEYDGNHELADKLKQLRREEEGGKR